MLGAKAEQAGTWNKTVVDFSMSHNLCILFVASTLSSQFHTVFFHTNPSGTVNFIENVISNKWNCTYWIVITEQKSSPKSWISYKNRKEAYILRI